MKSNAIEKLLTEHDVANITGLSLSSIRHWRLLGRGPKYIKIGAAVRYKPADVELWLSTRPAGGEGIRAVDTDRRVAEAGVLA